VRVTVERRRNGALKVAQNHSDDARRSSLGGESAKAAHSTFESRHDRRHLGGRALSLRRILSVGNARRSRLSRSSEPRRSLRKQREARQSVLPSGWSRRGGAWGATEGVRGRFDVGQGSTSRCHQGRGAGGPESGRVREDHHAPTTRACHAQVERERLCAAMRSGRFACVGIGRSWRQRTAAPTLHRSASANCAGP